MTHSHNPIRLISVRDDEIYGELGEDTLYGGEGSDIVIGDVGYAIRRYSVDEPITIVDDSEAFGNHAVWKKDIILEDLGNITNVVGISEKVDPRTQNMTAESVAAASLVFVASAYNKQDGSKYEQSGRLITEMFTFNLERAYDDHLEGGSGDDVLIGQRGKFSLIMFVRVEVHG